MRKDIHTAIASAQIDYANAVNHQKDLIEMAKYDIEYKRQIENRRFMVGQSVFAGREAQNISQEDMLYQTQLSLQKSQWEWEQKVAQDAQVRNDPTLSTQVLIDSYRKNGVNAERSDAEIIAWVEQEVAKGRSLGEVQTELNKAFQSKDAYKAMEQGRINQLMPTQYQVFGDEVYRIQNGQLTKTGVSTADTRFGFQNVGNGTIAVTNPKTGEVTYTQTGTINGVAPPNGLSAKYAGVENGTYVGVQCGTFARSFVGMDSLPGGNSLSERKRQFADK